MVRNNTLYCSGVPPLYQLSPSPTPTPLGMRWDSLAVLNSAFLCPMSASDPDARSTMHSGQCNLRRVSSGGVSPYMRVPFPSLDESTHLLTMLGGCDMASIYGNFRVITHIFKKIGNLPLCLENYSLFSLRPIFTNIFIHIH